MFSLDVITFILAWTYVILAPHAKIEELFNLHATHDGIFYGFSPSGKRLYDHFVYPAVVPRTFIGSIALSCLTRPVVALCNALGFGVRKEDIQVLARLVLATVNASSFVLLRRAVSRRFGRRTGNLFSLFTLSQFHLLFWMGRTLPNMFAIFPLNVALSRMIPRSLNALRPTTRSTRWTLALLTFATVVFRSEILPFLGSVALQSLLLGWLSFFELVKTGIVAGFVSLALTVGVDSYFWETLEWPELSTVIFNVFEGKSVGWGVSPWHTYFTSFLPKLLFAALPLSLFGPVLDRRLLTLIIPAVGFVCLISGLGHKEWRFVVYIVPLFNVAAARTSVWLLAQKSKGLFGKLAALMVPGALLANCVMTFLLTLASIENYPGGHALTMFNSLYENRTNVHVFISNLAYQTGGSLFQHAHKPPYASLVSPFSLFATPTVDGLDGGGAWIYNLTACMTPLDVDGSTHYTHAIMEEPPAGVLKDRWVVTGVVGGFERWGTDLGWVKRAVRDGALDPGGWKDAVRLERRDRLWIWERK